jgi:hypothetical protein
VPTPEKLSTAETGDYEEHDEKDPDPYQNSAKELEKKKHWQNVVT